MEYHIYRFKEEEPSARMFDVSMCFKKNESNSFEFQLEG